jgi:hypothetical protein
MPEITKYPYRGYLYAVDPQTGGFSALVFTTNGVVLWQLKCGVEADAVQNAKAHIDRLLTQQQADDEKMAMDAKTSRMLGEYDRIEWG